MKTRISCKGSFVLLFSLCGLLTGVTLAEDSQPPLRSDIKTRVTFATTDQELQRLYDTAVAKAKGNLVQFTPSMKVLVEGGGYGNAWIPTRHRLLGHPR